MTELTPSQPMQPQAPAEEWGSTQYFEGLAEPGLMLGHGYKMPSPDHNDGEAKLIHMDRSPSASRVSELPQVATPPSQPVIEQPRVVSRPEFGRTLTPEGMRELRKQVAEDAGEAAVDSAVQPKIIDAMPSFEKPAAVPVAEQVQANAASARKEISEEAMNKIRTEVDNKYNQVMQFGGTSEDAEAAAQRVWKHYGL